MDYEVELAFVISKRGKHIKVLYNYYYIIIIIIMKVDEDRCIHTPSNYFVVLSRAGVRGHVPRGWLHGGPRCECQGLADAQERQAVAAGQDLRHLLSPRARPGHHLNPLRCTTPPPTNTVTLHVSHCSLLVDAYNYIHGIKITIILLVTKICLVGSCGE